MADLIGAQGLQEFPQPKYGMGFALNGLAIPDPTGFSGAESDLDTMGERDATGYLHRNKVATKYPLKLEYSNVPWEWIMDLCPMLRHDKFQFTFPDPFNGGHSTIDAYVGDRDFEAVWAPEGGIYIGTLKFSVIEY